MAITQQTKTPVVSADAFASGILGGIGAPDSPSNHSFIIAWMGGENTNARNNPLATTQPAQGTSDFNSIGVKNYPSPQVGLTATVQTLLNGYYNGIVSDLRKGNVAPQSIINNNASELGTWGTGAGLVSTRFTQLQAGQISSASVAPGLTGAPSGGGGGGGFLGGVVSGAESAAGGVAGAVTNPIGTAGGLLGDLGGGISSALGLDKIGKDIMYAVAILGGGAVMLLGILLVGADLGLSVLASRNPLVAGTKKAVGQRRSTSTGRNYKIGQRQGDAANARKAGRQSRVVVHAGAASNREQVEKRAAFKKKVDAIPSDTSHMDDLPEGY